MCSKKMMLAVLLCITLLFGLAACGEKTDDRQSDAGANLGGDVTQNGGDEDNNSENNGDNNGENSGDNAGEEETFDPAKKPFEPGDGDSLKEFAGLWAQSSIEYPVYIQEDGTWGRVMDDVKEPCGIIKYEDGKLFLAMEDDGYWEVIEFTTDQDGNLVSEVSEPLYRYSWLLPEAEKVDDCFAGYWKGEEEEFWLCINRDATWYEVDASGKTVDEGYVCTFCMEEELEGMIILVNDSPDKAAIILTESDDHLYGDRKGRYWSGCRTVNLPGSDELSPVYVGTWMFSELDIAVILREDGTWTSYSPYQELITEGKLEPNQENNEITLALDGKNELTVEMYNVGYMYGDEGGLELAVMNPEAEQKMDAKYVGTWEFDWLRQWITINEDLTWNAVDTKGEVVNRGTVVMGREYHDELTVTLIPDKEGYPMTLRADYEQLHGVDTSEHHLGAGRVEAIPAAAKYAGVYYWEARERYVRVDQKGDIADTYKLDGTYWDTYYAYYKFNVETGEMSMTLSRNEELTLIPSADGGWADATGTHRLVPVDFVPSLDAWGELPIEDVWYYATKDVYLSFGKGFGFASDGPLGDCLVMDENGTDIGRGTVTFGPDAVYTVTVEGAELNVVLTLDRDGRLTDAEGNELVKAHNMRYRN